MYPAYLDVAFILLTLALYTVAVRAAKGAARRGVVSARVPFRVALGGGTWLLLIGLAASSGAFRDFHAMPPRFAFALVPAFVAMLVIGFSGVALRIAETLPHHAILFAQSFRIAMEWILWDLFRHGAMPRVMSFEGRNFDILVGLSALLLAVLWQRGVSRSRAVLRVWNWVGIAVLALTVSQGLLSAPTPFRQLFEPVSTAIVGEFPFIWLPAFVVQFAFLLHILSLRKLHCEAGEPG
jgi:hypothetical protein